MAIDVIRHFRDYMASAPDELEEILRPFSENAHLLSALDVEAEDVVKTAFGTNLPRLAAIKNKYDPTNFFRVNQNIALGTESAA
jgi:hypothetical protein